MKKVYNCLFLTLLLSVGMISCIDDSYDLGEFSSDVNFPATLVGPVGSSKITISDLLAKMNVNTGLLKESPEDHLLYFRYDDTIQIELEPVKFRFKRFDTLFTAQSPDLQLLIDEGSMKFQERLDFGELDDEKKQIDSVLISAGQLKIMIEQNLLNDASNVKIILHFPPEVHKPDGRKLPPDTLDVNRENFINLNNCVIDFTKEEDLAFTFEVSVSGGTGLLNEDSYINFSVEPLIQNFPFQSAWGYFKYPSESEKVVIDLFDGVKKEDINLLLQNPKLSLEAMTNLKLPAVFSIDSIQTIGGKNDVTAEFTVNGKKEPSYSVQFKDGMAAANLDNKNVNLDEVLATFPDSLNFNYGFEIGTPGKSTELNASVFAGGAFIDVNFGVELPAWFKKGSFIRLADTITDINLGDLVTSDVDLDKAIIYFDLTNGLPLGVDVNFSFLDSLGNSVIIENQALKKNLEIVKVDAAAVNPASSVVDKNKIKTTNLQIELNSSMTGDIKQCKHLVVNYKVNVDNKANSVKITSDNFLEAKMSFYLKGGIKLSDK